MASSPLVRSLHSQIGKVSLALLLAFLGCGASAQAEAPPPTSLPSVSDTIDIFGFRLLRTLVKSDSGENVIISPLSVSLALAIAYNGAAGDTKAAMAKTLAVSSANDDDLNRANHDLMDIIEKADPSVQMEIANALWAQSGFPINPAFLKLSRDSYGAPVESLDFEKAAQQAADTINAWVDKNTHGKIPKIIERGDPTTRLMITDAVYFKGRWALPFDKKATQQRDFHLQNGESVKAPMMFQRGKYPYFETDGFQAIRLSYGKDRFAMYIFLPRKRAGLSDFLSSLDQPRWAQWMARFSDRKGEIVLPKLESSWGTSLNSALKAMGMAIAFDAGSADFSRINSTQLFIKDVEHKTYIKVDEEGTEAAAVTSIGVSAAAVIASPPPFEMVVDHPFFCAILEQESGALLFAGVVTDPTRRK